MKAVWYERAGSAEDVLQIGTMATPEAGAGEVRIRVAYSAVNPYDVKKRANGLKLASYEHIVPHTDGSGEIDRVGEGVPRERIGERVWIFGGQAFRASGQRRCWRRRCYVPRSGPPCKKIRENASARVTVGKRHSVTRVRKDLELSVGNFLTHACHDSGRNKRTVVGRQQ